MINKLFKEEKKLFLPVYKRIPIEIKYGSI